MCTVEPADAPKDITPTRLLSSQDPTKKSVVHKSATQPHFKDEAWKGSKALRTMLGFCILATLFPRGTSLLRIGKEKESTMRG